MITICVATLCGGTNCFAGFRATAVPLNAGMVCVRLPADSEMTFVRSVEAPEVLIGPADWRAVERPAKRMLNVIRGDVGDPQHDEYCFIGGKLKFMSVGGKDAEVKEVGEPLRQDIASLWPTEESRRDDMLKNQMWRVGHHRLALFTCNPNRSALILAHLTLILSGLLTFCKRRIFAVFGCLAALAGGVLVALTQSRGGLLALAAGLVAIGFFWFRSKVWCRRIPHLRGGGVMASRHRAILVLVAVLAFAAVFVGGATYYMCASQHAVHSGLHDASSANRIFIWREVPRMIAAAPMGWGLWQSGPAYNSWFEKPNRMHSTGDLFNDHFSRFVEGGFVFGGLYVFLWVFVFVVSWRHAWRGGSPVPLALFASYFIASSFNPMNYWAPSFCVMGGYLLAATLWRCRRGTLPRLRVLVNPFALSLAITLVLLAVIAVVALCAGEQDVPLRVSTLGRRVVVGRGEAKVWVADDGFVLCGDYNGFPGRELRDFYRMHPNAQPIGLVESLSALPKNVERLIVTGKLCEEFLEHPDRIAAKQILVYSPPFGSMKIKPALRKKYDIEFLTGEFVARLTGDDRIRSKWVHIVPGAELYVPHWLDMVVRKGE